MVIAFDSEKVETDVSIDLIVLILVVQLMGHAWIDYLDKTFDSSRYNSTSSLNYPLSIYVLWA